jgi:hypothetical protein
MLEYLRKKIEALVDSIIDPIWKRLMAARPLVKIMVVLAGLAVFVAIKYPDPIKALYLDGRAIARVVRAEPKTIPLGKDIATRTRNAVSRLSETMRSDLLTLQGSNMTPWATAQTVAAASGLGTVSFDKPAITASIRTRTIPGCACWAELPRKVEEPACTFISGWVLAAFADLDIPASSAELLYLLDRQDAHGWWPTFNIVTDSQFASTYSTAWILIGLLQQKRKHLIAPQYVQRVDDAITRGTGWLLAQRTKGARWKPYPNSNAASESESISGLALHALHLAVPDQVTGIDQQWLEQLPANVNAASDGENYYIEMEGSGSSAIDTFVQIKVPWMMVATVDAFENGSVLQRARALNWLERTLRTDSLQNADANAKNWWRAELLYALRHLLSHS